MLRSDNEVGAAVEMAFEAASSEKRMLANAAKCLRRRIFQSLNFSSEKETPWPPSADYLQSPEQSPPPVLTEFLELLITGKSKKTTNNASERTERLATSIAEDVCVAVTHAKLKIPKHLLLGVSLHHLTGSAQIVTMLNRFGHCCSYSQVLDLENAMVSQVQSRDSVLPYNISIEHNIVANFCWDNFDLTEETPSGSGTTHSTHGILIQ